MMRLVLIPNVFDQMLAVRGALVGENCEVALFNCAMSCEFGAHVPPI
jgi:hypothetical protein